MSEALTRGIRVHVESEYSPERSQLAQNQWFFVYTITISNEGPETVQLLTRHWMITDGTGRIEEVRGPGVVGKQPTLSPGESFTYSSGCHLTSPFGVMEGTYQMVTDEGDAFDVEDRPVHAERAVHGALGSLQLPVSSSQSPALSTQNENADPNLWPVLLEPRTENPGTAQHQSSGAHVQRPSTYERRREAPIHRDEHREGRAEHGERAVDSPCPRDQLRLGRDSRRTPAGSGMPINMPAGNISTTAAPGAATAASRSPR